MQLHSVVLQLDFNAETQLPFITQPALTLCTCWSLCHLLTKASRKAAADLRCIIRKKYLGRSCERHFVYAHVRRYRGSCRWPESWQNIDDSRWKAGLSKQYERKQALVEMTTEPSKTTGGAGESGPNPTSWHAESGGNIKKKEKEKATDR